MRVVRINPGSRMRSKDTLSANMPDHEIEGTKAIPSPIDM